MSDIFISYSNKDRNRAKEVVTRLMQEGWSVFWDRTIPVASTWDEILEMELNAARVIVVLWSQNSVKSEWVRAEATEGANRRIIVPALLETTTIPFRFRLLQAADISDWKFGESDTEGMHLLIEAVARFGNLKRFQKAKTAVKSTSIVRIGQKKRSIISPLYENLGTEKDVDWNEYDVVKIGSQIWMAENLKTTKYNNGTAIPMVNKTKEWRYLKAPGYCWYKNELYNKNNFGALYNWYAVNTGKLCPKGWHVPTDYEWNILADYLGGRDIAGGKLKETGTIHWSNPNTGATNETHFTAIPGGYRYTDGAFYDIMDSSCWWSATEFDAASAWSWFLTYRDTIMGKYNDFKNNGISVRCIKDN